MSDILLLQERIRNTISLGESHFREFKSALHGPPTSKTPRPAKEICKDIAEALVAFANADGGDLLVGVEDDGSITGLRHPENEIKLLLASPVTHITRNTTLPIQIATLLSLEGKQVLFFSVSKGVSEIYQLSDGRCVRRKDKSTEPVRITDIQFERQEIKSREYDRQFVDGATVNDLDYDLVNSLASKYLKGLSVERYLQQIGLGEYTTNGLRLRMATLLLFAKDIQRWHPRSQVRILKVNGTEVKYGELYNITADEIVRGNIFELLITSWERLRPFLAIRTSFGANARFEQKFIYPESVAREALTNAIAHRDYSIQNGIDIFIFDDRMEIKNPGALLSTLTIKNLEELQGLHESRNVLVAKVLRENEYMRELGEGMHRIFHTMRDLDLEKPSLYSNSSFFSVILSHKSIYSSQDEEFLKNFDSYKLTSHQKRIVVLGRHRREISRRDIQKALSTRDRDIYDREVTQLRKLGILREINTNSQAKIIAKRKNIDKDDVGRFEVVNPIATENE